MNRCDAQAGIESDDTRRIRKQRVDVELTDLGVIGGELTEPDQYLCDRRDIRRRVAAIALQQLRAIRRRANNAFSGGSSSELSWKISTAVPPWPNATSGPKTGSSTSPATSSTAP